MNYCSGLPYTFQEPALRTVIKHLFIPFVNQFCGLYSAPPYPFQESLLFAVLLYFFALSAITPEGFSLAVPYSQQEISTTASRHPPPFPFLLSPFYF